MKYYKLTSQQWDQNKELLPGIKGKKGSESKFFNFLKLEFSIMLYVIIIINIV